MQRVYRWGDDSNEIIDCDSIIEVADWCDCFSGNYRLPNDVGLPLERCMVGSYQIGYLFDYNRCKDRGQRITYFEEGIASVLIHIIASYEMIDREFSNLFDPTFTWSGLRKFVTRELTEKENLYNISQYAFKYQRWMMYNHMKRTKRWDEREFRNVLLNLVISCIQLANVHNCDMKTGFQLAMSKLQDGEIKRH